MYQTKTIQLFQEAKYGLMLHFGLYSLLGGCYKGMKGPAYAEWTQCYFQIPNSEMERLAAVFNPIYFDAEEICSLMEECGMKYLVVTAKHHEGFALFPSKADPFNIFDFSPCKRDLIGELSRSCKRHNILFGVYYSQVIDWHEKDGGGYNADPKGAAGPTWENSWDFPDKSQKNFELCLEKKILPQIEELLKNYDNLSLFWFDMPLDAPPSASKKIYELVKKLSPDCLVNSRLGSGFYDYVTLGDNEIPDEIPSSFENTDKNDIWGMKYSPSGLYESAGTMNSSWGFTLARPDWKDPKELLQNRIKLERLHINYLLNIGLDYLGRVPVRAREILRSMQEEYLKNLWQKR